MDEGASVRFVSTHFDHRGQASREAAAREINRLFSGPPVTGTDPFSKQFGGGVAISWAITRKGT